MAVLTCKSKKQSKACLCLIFPQKIFWVSQLNQTSLSKPTPCQEVGLEIVNTPRSCRSKWDLNGQICSPAISIWHPIPGDFPRCHVRKSCAALIYGIGGCLILQSPEMLGKYGSWWVVKIQWRARWSLNTFCFVLLFLQFPVSAWLPSIPILVRKLLDIS